MLPAPVISTKNKHLLAIDSTPARGFTAAVSVFRGTPPPKPLRCKFKIRCRHSTALGVNRWAEPTGGKQRVSRACFRVVPLLSSNRDIIKMSPGSRSQSVHLSFKFIAAPLRSRSLPHLLHDHPHPVTCRKQKTLLTRGKQGFRKSLFVSLPAYQGISQIRFGVLLTMRPG